MQRDWKKIAAISLIAFAGLGVGLYLYQQKVSTQIVEFNYQEHGAFVNRALYQLMLYRF